MGCSWFYPYKTIIMKNLLFPSLTVFILTILLFPSCEKGSNPLKPYETTEHPIIWSYNMGMHNTGSKTIPAMDTEGNIYFAVQNNSNDPISLFAIDKTGNELWKKEFTGKLTAQIIYQEAHLYFSAQTSDSRSITWCLTSSDGEIAWANSSQQKGGCVMAVSHNYIVTGALSGGYVVGDEDTYELQMMDKTGEILTPISIGNGVAAISIVGNTLYYITNHVSGTGYAKIELVKYNLSTGAVEWVHAAGNDQENWRVASPDLVVDNNDKVYFVSQFGLNVTLHIINSDGSVFKEITLKEVNDVTLTPSLDTEGNIYIGAPGYLQKYSPEGNLIWSFEDYNYTSASINITYAPVLASGEKVYYGGEGLFAVNTTPEMAYIVYPETGFTAPGYPLINNDGDIITIGDGFVNCIKGDGLNLQNSAWPKIYQNIGNTASR
jgi:hypothetical protein